MFKKSINKLIPVLCIVIFIDGMGAGFIAPIMPKLMLNPQVGLIQGYDPFIRDIVYGLSFAMFPLAGLLGMPLLGILSDNYGRRKILLRGFIGLVISYFLSAIAIWFHNLTLFLLSRLIEGFFVGTYTIATASIADISQDEKTKMNNFRWPMLASVSGFLIGPMLGGSAALLEKEYGLVLPFFITFLLSIMNLILLYFLFPEDHGKTTYVPQKGLIKQLLTAVSYIFRANHIKFLIISFGCFKFGIVLFMQSLSLLFVVYYHYDITQVSMLYLTLGIGVLINVLGVQPLMQKKMKLPPAKMTLIILSILTLTFMIQFLLFAVNFYLDRVPLFMEILLWVNAFILGLLLVTSATGYMARFSASTSSDEQGLMMGGVGELNSLMRFLGGLCVGYLVHAHELALSFMVLVSISIGLVLFIYSAKRDAGSN